MEIGSVKGAMKAVRLATVLLLVSASWAAALTIDDFNDANTTVFPPGIIQNTLGSTTVTDTGLAGVIGGARTLTVTAFTLSCGLGCGPDNVTAGAAELHDFFAYSSTLGAEGEFELLYDRNGAGLNVSLIGLDHLQLTVVTADLSSVPYDVTVTLTDNTQSKSSTQTITAAGGRALIFPMSDFFGLDLDAIQSIKLTVFPMNFGSDLELDRFDALPTGPPAPALSPAMIIVLVGMLGVVGLFGLARSRVSSPHRQA